MSFIRSRASRYQAVSIGETPSGDRLARKKACVSPGWSKRSGILGIESWRVARSGNEARVGSSSATNRDRHKTKRLRPREGLRMRYAVAVRSLHPAHDRKNRASGTRGALAHSARVR